MKIIKYILYLLISLLITSCELFSLKLQQDYEYVSNPPNNRFEMSAYKFIESRKEIDCRLMLEAIDSCDLKAEYEAEDRTYVLLNDVALRSWLNSYKYYQIKNADRNLLNNLLKQFIGLKSFGALDLTTYAEPIPTLLPDVPLYLSVLPQTLTQQNPYQVVVNNFAGSKNVTYVITSNIQVDNGFIYVVEKVPAIRR